MPNTKQAKKRNRQDDERRLRNKAARSRMRTAIKKVDAATDAEAAQGALPLAFKTIDKAAKSHVIHENAAARLKSRLTRKVAAKG